MYQSCGGHARRKGHAERLQQRQRRPQRHLKIVLPGSAKGQDLLAFRREEDEVFDGG